MKIYVGIVIYDILRTSRPEKIFLSRKKAHKWIDKCRGRWIAEFTVKGITKKDKKK